MPECALSRRVLRQNKAAENSCTRLRNRNRCVKQQRDAWPASRMANERRSPSGVSFGRTGAHVADLHAVSSTLAVDRSIAPCTPPQSRPVTAIGPIRQPC